MQLPQGALAPDFATSDMFDRPIRLSDFKGRPVMLSFMRYASCPLCNLRMRELVLAHEQLAAQGLVLLVVFQSTAQSMGEYVGPHDAPFALIPDPAMALYRLYGVERGWAGFLAPSNIVGALRAFRRGFLPGRIEGPIERMPADFLIGPEGRVHRSFYAPTAAQHIPLAEVTRWLQSGRPARADLGLESAA